MRRNTFDAIVTAESWADHFIAVHLVKIGSG
jgi:hypothetical protein